MVFFDDRHGTNTGSDNDPDLFMGYGMLIQPRIPPGFKRGGRRKLGKALHAPGFFEGKMIFGFKPFDFSGDMAIERGSVKLGNFRNAGGAG